MDHHIYPSELAILLIWLTAPQQIMMLLALSLWGFYRGVFARPLCFRSVLVLIAAYMAALVLAVPVWLLLPTSLLPSSVLPDKWPSFPPLGFTPAWIACSVGGLGAWFVMGRFVHVTFPKPPLAPMGKV
jgi:hypothetical protein